MSSDIDQPINKAIGSDGAVRTIPQPVALRVWAAAGGRCTMCNRYLLSDDHTGNDIFIGQMAHIVGWQKTDGSPRSEDDLPLDQRNSADNLMLLCYDQHKVIDSRSLWDVYDVDTLMRIKRTHEKRIKELSALRNEDRTTVIRLVGALHGHGVELSRTSIATALLAEGRYPDYALLGVDEYEIDLRSLGGERESQPGYWLAARDMIHDRLAHLTAKVNKERINHLSIFALSRIPLLITLGTRLDDTIPTVVYPKRRGDEKGWGWSEDESIVNFEYNQVREANNDSSVAILFSISGTVDPARLPYSVDQNVTVYEVRPVSEAPNPELIRNAASLNSFSSCWRDLLAHLEQKHPGVVAIDVFAAVPVTAAVAIGRSLMKAVHPVLRIYDRDTQTDSYQFALETTR